MTRTKSSWPSQAAKQLVPINQLIAPPEGIPIPFDHLEIADLSHLPRGLTLVTFVGPSIKVLITKGTTLRVKLVYKIGDDDALAQKYSVKAVVRAMSPSIKVVPADPVETKRLPSLTGASWKLPDEATRQFELPVNMTGAEVLAAVRASDEFVVRTTEILLAQNAEAQDQMVQS